MERYRGRSRWKTKYIRKVASPVIRISDREAVAQAEKDEDFRWKDRDT